MRRIVLITIAAAILALLAGFAAEAWLAASVPIIGSWVRLDLTHNPGIAFGVTLPSTLQIALIAAAFVAVWFMARNAKRTIEHVAYGLILGGALANIADRLPDGLVTDFVAVQGFSVFNLADTWITVGAALLLLDAFFSQRAAKVALK